MNKDVIVEEIGKFVFSRKRVFCDSPPWIYEFEGKGVHSGVHYALVTPSRFLLPTLTMCENRRHPRWIGVKILVILSPLRSSATFLKDSNGSKQSGSKPTKKWRPNSVGTQIAIVLGTSFAHLLLIFCILSLSFRKYIDRKIGNLADFLRFLTILTILSGRREYVTEKIIEYYLIHDWHSTEWV